MAPKEKGLENQQENVGDQEGGDTSAGTSQEDAGNEGTEEGTEGAGGDNAQTEGSEVPEGSEEGSEEGETEEGEEGSGDEELTGEDDKPLSLKSQKRVQIRMDGMTSIINRQAEEIGRLKGLIEGREGSEQKKGEKVWTKDDLLQMINDPDQQKYHAWAIDKLTDLKAEERDRKNKEESRVLTVKEQSYDKAIEKFPDMLNPQTKLWQLANKIYLEEGLENVPDGQYLASLKASDQLGIKPNTGGKKMMGVNPLKKQLDKERAKSSLAGSGKKATTSDQSVLDKLESLAVGTKPGSVEWLKYQRKLEEVGLKKAQKKE
jgi:hypothetical protein